MNEEIKAQEIPDETINKLDPKEGDESDIDELLAIQEKLASVQEESEQRLVAWQRARADYENLKKRSQQEVAERSMLATATVLLTLLPVVDDFERALESEKEPDPLAWVDGVQLIQKKLFHLLEQVGLQPIAAEGQAFDPKFHEAIGKGNGREGYVVTQVLKGYLLGQRVLRPSQVIVGNGDDDSSAEGMDQTAGQD